MSPVPEDGFGLTGQPLDELPEQPREGFVERAAESTPRPGRRDPAKALTDLQLPQDILKVLGPPLAELRFLVRAVKTKELKQRRKLKPHANERTYTVAERDGSCVFLLHLAPTVAQRAAGIFRDAVAAIGYEFNAQQLVPVFSLKKQVIDSYITDTLMRSAWDINSFFVPYQRITDLGREADVSEYVTQILHLDEARDARLQLTVTADQRRRLRDAIVAAYATSQLLEEALQLGLDRNIHELVREGTTPQMANQLIVTSSNEAWIDQLITALALDQPSNLVFKGLAEELGLLPGDPAAQGN